MTDTKLTISKGSVSLGTFRLANDGPTECGLKLYRGDTFTLTFLFADATTSAPLVLQGTWTAQIREHPNSADVLATFTVDASQLAAGSVTLSLDSTTTTTLVAGVWDLQETDTNGTVTTWLYGTIAVAEDVTH